MKNYQCLYVKGIFIDIISALECKLNPCFNGIQNYFAFAIIPTQRKERLNPCSNGIRKYYHSLDFTMAYKAVLILVLMEY